MIRLHSVVWAALVFCTSFTFGQVRVGVHGGLNLSDVLEPDNNIEGLVWLMRPHMQGGIAIDYAMSEHFLIAAQVNLIQKGVLVIGETLESAPWGYTSFTNNYVEVPICVRWRIGEEPFRWFAECGPALAFLESARALIVIPGRQDYDFEYIPRYLHPDISLTVGAGGEYNLTGSLFLTFSVHYAHGMSEVYPYAWKGSRPQEVQFDLGALVSL